MADATNNAMQVVTQAKQLWDRQTKRRKTLAFGLVGGIVALVAIVTLLKKTETWSVVADGASPDDIQEIFSLLQNHRVVTRLHEGKVEVEAGQLEEARMVMSSEGLPRSAGGWETFDDKSLGDSAFKESIKYRRAQEGELGRSIAALAQVESARVHLALGRKSVFADQTDPASASIALHLHPGQRLTAEQVRGIRQLVASSIDGLKAENVALVDSHGNLLDAADPTSADRRAEIEHKISTKVRALLERLVGQGKVSVVATAVVDDRKVNETQEVYDADHPALRSMARTVEGADPTGGGGGGNAGVGGIAGARGNLPGATANAPTASAGTGKLSETKNYEINRTVRQVSKAEPQIQKLSLAVVVDWKTGADGRPVARTDGELTELSALARQAAGLDDARGDKLELRAIQFAIDPDSIAAPAPAPAGLPLIPIIAGGAVVLVAAAVMFHRSRKRRAAQALADGRMLAFPTPVAELERVLEARPSLDTPATADEVPRLPPGQPVRERVLEVVRGDIERAAEVLTAWLSESPRVTEPVKGSKS